MIIQRVIEFLTSIPRIPLWMALGGRSAHRLVDDQDLFRITIVLSIVGWTGIARVVRGQLLELREEDFVCRLDSLRKSYENNFRHLLLQ